MGPCVHSQVRCEKKKNRSGLRQNRQICRRFPPLSVRRSAPRAEMAGPESPKPQEGKKAMIGAMGVEQIASCVFFLIAGPIVIFTNRYILKSVGFDYSMAVSSLGLVSSSVTAYALSAAGVVHVGQKEKITTEFYMKTIMPIGLTTAATIYFGNLAYLYLSVAFVQICKAFGPVILMFFVFAFGLDKPTLLLVFSIFMMAIGTSVSSYGELHFSMVGFIVIMTAQFSEGIKLVLSQILMTNLKFSVWEGMYYMGPASSFWLLVGVALHELPRMLEEGGLMKMAANPGLFFIAGMGGCAVNLATFCVVKTCSSLTLKVLATVRNIGIVYVSTLTLGDSMTNLEVLGYGISLIGFLAYNYEKLQKAQKTKLVDAKMATELLPKSNDMRV